MCFTATPTGENAITGRAAEEFMRQALAKKAALAARVQKSARVVQPSGIVEAHGCEFFWKFAAACFIGGSRDRRDEKLYDGRMAESHLPKRAKFRRIPTLCA